jgi:hypothetical protein
MMEINITISVVRHSARKPADKSVAEKDENSRKLKNVDVWYLM